MTLIKKFFAVFCGLFFVLVCLEGGLRGWGLFKKRVALRKEARALEVKGAYRILCLGESTTSNQYPQKLERILRRALPGKKISVFDGALAGIDSNFILDKVEADLDRYKPDLVTVMMGCNDGEEVLDYGDVGSRTELEWMFRVRVFCLLRLLWWNLEEKRKADCGDGGFVGEEERDEENTEIAEPEGGFEEKIRFYENRIRLEPDNSENYFRLGLIMIDRGDIDAAYKLFRKAQALDPLSAQVYGSLATTCPPDEMEHWVNLALEIEPEHGIEPTGTIRALMLLGRFDEALYYLEKVVSMSPEEKICFVRLGIIYMKRKEYDRARMWLETGLQHHPGDRQLLRALDLVCRAQGRTFDADAFADTKSESSGVLYENYNRLARILRQRGVRMVAVQYPVQSIGPLKKMLSAYDDVLFVDNEHSFREGIVREGFFAYFVDSFGGNFGHCTDKGNELVALNIARVILREVFGRNEELSA